MDRIDAARRVAIDDHRAVGADLDARGLEAKLGRVRAPAGGEKDEVGFLARAVAVRDLERAVGAPRERRRLGAEMDDHAFGGHLLGEARAEVGIEAA